MIIEDEIEGIREDKVDVDVKIEAEVEAEVEIIPMNLP